MIKRNTIEFKLVSLVGLAGEIQTKDLFKLKYGKEYIRKVISNLKSVGYIRAYKFENIKCLRLTAKCKKYLKNSFPERFSDSFVGAKATNKIRNDARRRMRYHRLGEVLVLADLAGIKIFADEKSLMKKTQGLTRAVTTDKADYSVSNNSAEFYTSAELKAAGLFMNARTSRALGIIYSHPDAYVIYNFGNELLRWESKTENSFLFRTVMMFSGTLDISPKLICVGRNAEIAEKILNSHGGNKKSFFKLNWHYNNIFFLDNSMFAPEQLRYLINKNLRGQVSSLIAEYFEVTKEYSIYGETEDGTIIANCTIGNLLTLKGIKETDLPNNKNIKIIHFSFQLPFLKKYLGNAENIEYHKIDARKILYTEDTQ